jgi:transcription elongation factor GreB
MTPPTSPASPNYITREGARKLQDELADLLHHQRAKVVQDVADAAAQGDRSENAEYIYGKRKLREIDRRIHWLTRRLESATVVERSTPPGNGQDQDGTRGEVQDRDETAFFGAFVEVEDENGARACYRIVGEDEIDLQKGHISWRSPLGRALLKKRAGDAVVFRRPSVRPGTPGWRPDAKVGEVELTVVSVRY